MNQITRANGDGKKFWQVINESFLKSTSPSINEVYTDEDYVLVKGKEAADEINNSLCQVSPKLSAKFGRVELPELNMVNINYFERAPLDEHMVLEQIRKIDITKSLRM